MVKIGHLQQDAYGILEHMKKGGKHRSGGFTIVETMIVLGVTGLLFTLILVTLSGRQARTQFEQSIQEVKSQIQQTINDVAAGYYPNGGAFKCVPSSSGPQFSAGSTDQGENAGCVFLGKVLQFKVASTDPEQFNVFSISGLQRVASTGNEVTTYAEAMPKAIAPSTTDGSIPDQTEKKNLLYGLSVYSMTYGTSNTPIGAVGFVNSLASYSGGNVVSGAQSVQMIPVPGTSLGSAADSTATSINTNLASGPLNPTGGVKICFASGTTNQSGLVTIGGNERQLSVTLSIKGNKTCS